MQNASSSNLTEPTVQSSTTSAETDAPLRPPRVIRPKRAVEKLVTLPISLLGLEAPLEPSKRVPSKRSLSIQARRLQILNRFNLFVHEGYPRVRAAEMTGSSVTTVWKIRQMHSKGGDAALLPSEWPQKGKRARGKLSRWNFSRLERLALLNNSPRKAWLEFAKGKDCPVEYSARIHPRRGYVPPGLLNQVKLRRVPATLVIGPTRFVVIIPKQFRPLPTETRPRRREKWSRN